MKKMLYSSLLLSILMSILFWHREPGISVVLFVVPTLLVIYFNLKQSQKIKNKKGIYWCIPIILLSLTYFIFNNTLFQGLNIPIILALIIIMCMDMTETQLSENSFIRNVVSKIFKPFSNFKKVLGTVKVKEKIKEEKQNEKIVFIKKLLKSLIIAVPLLLIVISLLSEADSVFENIFHEIPHYFSKIFSSVTAIDIFWRIIWIIFNFFYISGFILMFINEEKKQETKKEKDKTQKISTFTQNTILVSLNLIYLIFSIIQFKYLFINAGKTADFDYAQYARTGFFQLMMVSLINFGILKIGKVEQKEKLNTILKITMIVFTLVIIISAIFRMYLYEQAYGYTYLRLFVYFILATEILILIPITMNLLGKNLNTFKISLEIIVTMYVILNLINIDSIIASKNINRYLNDMENKKLDLYYIMNSTGTDAIKEKIKILNQSPEGLSITAQERLNDIKREAKIYLKGNKKYYQNKNMKWQEFNLSKNKAKEVLKYIDLTSNEVYEFNY